MQRAVQIAQRALSHLSAASGSVLSDWHLDPLNLLPSNRPNARAVRYPQEQIGFLGT